MDKLKLIMTKALLFTAILISISLDAISCGEAFQSRIIPLGEAKGKLIVLTMEMTRYWAPPSERKCEEQESWSGNCYIIQDFGNKNDTLKSWGEFYCKANTAVALKEIFSNAMKSVDTTSGFIKAETLLWEYVDFRYKHDILAINPDIENPCLHINKSDSCITLQKRAPDYGDKYQFKISSFRKLKIGEYNYCIVNLNEGEEGAYRDDILHDRKNYMAIDRNEFPVLPEQTQYHGHCYDIIIPL